MINKILCFLFGHRLEFRNGRFSFYYRESKSDWRLNKEQIPLIICSRCGETRTPEISLKTKGDFCGPPLVYGAQIEVEEDAE